MARAKRLMQQRKLEKELLEQEKEKEKELERRSLGKNLLDFKQKQVCIEHAFLRCIIKINKTRFFKPTLITILFLPI